MEGAEEGGLRGCGLGVRVGGGECVDGEEVEEGVWEEGWGEEVGGGPFFEEADCLGEGREAGC